MIIWSGMGKIVPAIAIIFMFICVPLGMWMLGERTGAAAGVIAAGVLSGLLVWLAAKGGEKQAAALIAAGQEVPEGQHPGTFFFIPTKTWAFLLPAVGVVLAFLTMSGAGQ